MKSLIIFDLDGTLLNSISDLGTATNYALSKLGLPTHHIDEYRFLVGSGVKKLLERALRDEDRTPEVMVRMQQLFTEYYQAHMTDLTRPYPGIMELLHRLVGQQVAVAVASNKYQAAVEMLVGHFFPDIPWVAVEGNKDGVPVKPDPSIVFEILGKCPTPKVQVLYAGDSGIDMKTAARAGVESVGVTWGFRPEQELVENHADHIAHHPADILDWIND